MFESPSSIAFNMEKEPFLLLSLPEGYEGETTGQKWQQLTDAFKETLPESLKISLEHIQQSRLNTIDTGSVIQLHQMLDYFETFFFLYNSEHPDFSLDEDKKQGILRDLTLALEEACEPGRQQKFESIIRYYRRDLNWISNTLYQLRHQQLEGMHDAYNAENFDEAAFQLVMQQHPEWTNDGINHRFDLRFRLWEPHTLSVMSELAQTKELGVEVNHVIDDLYMRDDQEARLKITGYFNRQFKQVFFVDYPTLAIDALAQHCVDEIVTMLKAQEENIDLTQWGEQPLVISLPTYRQFRDFLDELFSESHNPLSELIGYDDDSVTIINQLDVKNILKRYVKDKLVRQGFMYDLFDPDSRFDEQDLFHPETYSILDMLKALKLLFQSKGESTFTELQKFLLSHGQQLRNYPPFFYDIFIEQPQLIYAVPVDTRQNYYFSKQLIASFERHFNEHQKLTQAQCSALSYLYQSDPSIITLMPEAMLSDSILVDQLIQVRKEAFLFIESETIDEQTLAETLIEQDALSIFSMSETHKNNVVLLTSALNNLGVETNRITLKNYDDFIQVLNENYVRVYERHGLGELTEHQVSSFKEGLTAQEYQKLLVLDALMTRTNVSSEVFQKDASRLRPDTVLWVLGKREENNLPPIPGCSAEQLQKFISYYEDTETIDKSIFGFDAWCSSSFETLREKALDNYYNEPENDTSWFAITLLVPRKEAFFKYVFINSNNWVEGFNKFQRIALNQRRPFYHFSDVIEQVSTSCKLLLISGGIFLYGLGELIFHLLHLMLRMVLLVLSGFVLSFAIAYLLAWVLPWPLIVLWDNINRIVFFMLTVIMNTSSYGLPNNAFGHIVLYIQQACEFILPPSVASQFRTSLTDFIRLFGVEVGLIYEAFASFILRSIESFKATELSLPFTINGIIERLTCKQDHISQQKAELLKIIWSEIQLDPEFISEKLSPKECLNKSYKVVHLGEMIECSFNEVTKCHRGNCSDAFSLAETTSTGFCFFNNKTHSEREIEKYISKEDLINASTLVFAL